MTQLKEMKAPREEPKRVEEGQSQKIISHSLFGDKNENSTSN